MLLEFKPSFQKGLEKLKKTNPQINKRIHELINDILRHPFEGIGKPEPLKYEFSGCWSRRIDKKNRIIYKVLSNDDNTELVMLIFLTCEGHYN